MLRLRHVDLPSKLGGTTKIIQKIASHSNNGFFLEHQLQFLLPNPSKRQETMGLRRRRKDHWQSEKFITRLEHQGVLDFAPKDSPSK